MADVVESFEANRPAQLFERARGPLARGERHDLILAAVDHVGRNGRERIELLVAGRGRHRDRGREDIRVPRRDEPRAPAAEAESGHENAAWIDLVVGADLLNQRHHGSIGNRIGPRRRRAVPRDDEGVQAVEAARHHLLAAGGGVVRKARAARMQREHERPRLLSVVAARNGNRVRHRIAALDGKHRSMQTWPRRLKEGEENSSDDQNSRHAAATVYNSPRRPRAVRGAGLSLCDPGSWDVVTTNRPCLESDDCPPLRSALRRDHAKARWNAVRATAGGPAPRTVLPIAVARTR